MDLPAQGRQSRTTRILAYVAGAIALLLALFWLLLDKSCSYYPLSDDNSERVTSPDGKLDAVLICEGYGGAVGGVYWFVYVVPKGEAPPMGPKKALYEAGDFEGEKLVWTEAHVLELRHDHAEQVSIRESWIVSQVENVGPTGERQRSIEVRLGPSSPN